LRKKIGLGPRITGYFLRGLFTLLPLFITIWLLFFMFSFLDGILGGIIALFVGRYIPGLGFLITLLLTLITGFLMTYLIGEKLFLFSESIITRVPIMKSIYSSAKQINDVLFQQKEAKSSHRACIVEYPRKGIYSLGFVTSDAASEIKKKTGGGKMINVFIPNTPTPATGFLIVVPAHEVKLLDMRIDDAFKYIVSGGVLQPKK